MTAKIDKTGAAITRRRALQRAGFAGVAAAFGSLPFMRSARATDITLRWWSPQSAPAQLAAYKFQIAQFEAANPGVKVVFEPTSDETYPAQMAAAYASGQVPDVVTHIPSFSVASYYAKGLVEPFDDVIKVIGLEKYYEGANQTYKAGDGHFTGTGIGNTAADNLWVRKDLMQKASIDKISRYLGRVANRSKEDAGRGYLRRTAAVREEQRDLVRRHDVDPRRGRADLHARLASRHRQRCDRECVGVLQIAARTGAARGNQLLMGELITAFVSGATATGYYAGRVLVNVSKQNPSIADQITCAQYPTISASVPKSTLNDFPSVFIPKGTKNLEAAKKFGAFLFEPDGYIKQLLAAPGHVLPVLKPIATNPAYTSDPIIKKYPKEIDLMTVNAANGYNMGFERSCTQAEH